MIIRPINTLIDDNNDLRALCESRNVQFYDMPQFGLVAYEHEYLVAAGFLRPAEGGVVIMEGFITNDSMNSKIRHKALTLIANKLIQIAKLYDKKIILLYTRDDSVLMRSKSHGFIETGHKVASLDLTSGQEA